MLQLRNEVESLAAILHPRVPPRLSKNVRIPKIDARMKFGVRTKYREANNNERKSLSGSLTPVRQSNSTSLSDPESGLAEARMTLRWPCRLDPRTRRNFRWRRAPRTPALSAAGLCFRSVTERLFFNRNSSRSNYRALLYKKKMQLNESIGTFDNP